MEKIFRFILGVGYTFLSGLCIWGLYTFVKESTDISEDLIYIILFIGVSLLLAFAAYCSFKQSVSKNEPISSRDMSTKDLLIQTKNIENKK